MCKKIAILLLSMVCVTFTGCGKIRAIVDSYDAPTQPVKTTNESQYTVVRSEAEIEAMILQTMQDNKTTCYFNVADEKMIDADLWAKTFDGVYSIDVEYALAQSGYNVFVTLTYWDNYPIVSAFQKNDTTILNATQLELFDKYCDILGTCTSKAYSQYENELAIHDYLVSNVQYCIDPDKGHSAYEALIKQSAVCDGYAESFKTLLDMLGIENRVIRGTANNEAHGWNLIKLDDQWYHVDVTWDDPINGDGSISHKYFNVNDEDMALDHIWDSELYPQANGAIYAYYAMSGMPQLRSQAELDAYIQGKVAEGAEKIEFIMYGEVDLNQALQAANQSLGATGVAMTVSYNIMKRTQFSVYDITIVYN